MTKGALYRHYQSKREISDHILERMEQGDSDHAENYGMPENDTESTRNKYEKLSLDNFIQYCKSEMQALYQQYLVSGPVGYVKNLFESMGIGNAEMKADQFCAIMFLYYGLFDGAKDKEKVKQAFALLSQNWDAQQHLYHGSSAEWMA